MLYLFYSDYSSSTLTSILCNGEVEAGYYDSSLGWGYIKGNAAACILYSWDLGYDCTKNDRVIASFISVDQCVNTLTGAAEPCAKNCKDPYVRGATAPETEACDGIDNNCNGQIDEGCPVKPKCDLKIAALTADSATLNPSAGGSVAITGSVIEAAGRSRHR